MEGYFNNKSIFTLIGKWKKHLFVLVVLVAIISGGATYLIKPLFNSYATLYPVNLAPLSDENETEQMLQIIQSNDIKFALVDALDLNKHYKLNTKDPLYLSTLMYKFSEYISFSKTEYESVKLTVLDEDPAFAKKMVDSIIVIYNREVRDLHRIKFKEVIDLRTKEIIEKIKEIDSLERRATYLREEYGILDYGWQVKELTRSYYRLLGTNQAKANEAKLVLDNIKKYGGEYKALSQRIIDERNQLKVFKEDLEEKTTEYNKNITYAHIVEKPFVADKKVSPVRWIIVVLSAFGALVFGLVLIAFIESKKSTK